MSSTFIFMISFLIISLDLTHIFRTSTGFSVNHSAPPPPCTDWHLHHTASCLHLQFMTPSPTLCRQALMCALGFCPLHWLGDTTAATLTSLPVSPSPLCPSPHSMQAYTVSSTFSWCHYPPQPPPPDFMILTSRESLGLTASNPHTLIFSSIHSNLHKLLFSRLPLLATLQKKWWSMPT